MSEVGLHLYCGSFAAAATWTRWTWLLSIAVCHSTGKPGWCRNGIKIYHHLSCWDCIVADEGEDVGYLLVWTIYGVLSSYVRGTAVCTMLLQDPKWEVSVCPWVSWQPRLILCCACYHKYNYLGTEYRNHTSWHLAHTCQVRQASKSGWTGCALQS